MACLFFFNADFKLAGTISGFLSFGLDLGGSFTPASFNLAASLMYPVNAFFPGKSEIAVIRPKRPMALFPDSSGPFPLKINARFQKPNQQWPLNAAMWQSIPLWTKCGKLHLRVSSTSGQAA